MLTIIIPTLNSAKLLNPTLTALVPGIVNGLVGQLVVSDGGSTDRTLTIAGKAGANILSGTPSRGTQLAAGGREATGDWLLFLHADTALEAGWEQEVRGFIEDSAGNESTAASFRFQLNDKAIAARWLERIVAARCRMFGLPYGDQGLLISREFYNSIGGFHEIPLMEDVDLVRRIGRDNLHFFQHAAITDARRYKRGGYLARIARNTACLTMWFAGVKPERIAGFYK